jgi:hypothetical protein
MGSVVQLSEFRERRAARQRAEPPSSPALDEEGLAAVVEMVAPDLVHITTTERGWAVIGPALQSSGVQLIRAAAQRVERPMPDSERGPGRGPATVRHLRMTDPAGPEILQAARTVRLSAQETRARHCAAKAAACFAQSEARRQRDRALQLVARGRELGPAGPG